MQFDWAEFTYEQEGVKRKLYGFAAILCYSRSTHDRALERRAREPLSPLPAAFAWERFATQECNVSWDDSLSYDGVLSGLPSEPPLA